MSSAEEVQKESRFTSGTAIVWYIAAAVLLVHLLTASRYGYFGDEMYHMACGEHLAWGYVDQPPLIAVFAWLTRHLFGTSVFAVHLFPALAGFVLVWLTGLITRELGGGRFAQGLAATCAACAGVYLILDHLFTMNAFEPLLWMGCAYVVIRIIKTGNQTLWVWFGVLAGIGLENKYSMAVFGFAVVMGLLLTKERKALASKWIWIGGLIAFAIFLPNLIWNFQHHWPFLELMRNIRAGGRDMPFTPLGYIRAQIFLMTPVTFPVWLLGALYFFFWERGKPFRVLGWAFIILLALFIVLHGKDYYAAPVFPMVFAGGAIAIEQLSQRSRMAWVKPASVALILAGTLALLPLFVPVLSPEGFLRYQAKLPFNIQPDEKSMLSEPMPHYYSWCFGWDEMVRAVAEAYSRVPASERADTAILADNFAEAGAIDLIGPKYGLPKAVSGHQSYWLWGPRNYSGNAMIIVGDRPEEAAPWFDEVTAIAQLHNPYAAPWENRPVLLCHGSKHFHSLAEVWPQLKNWD
ncbi:MAG TPA: glycosyltransferase family 39 protein [Candidatus Acidoferrum sp.]|nr:glycosyltransferase family 39 protein [Candidatus Acidoferrum sp.]